MPTNAPPMARPRVAASALFFDEDGRLLLVHSTFQDSWDIPGGYVEPGEPPQDACRREVVDELGLDRTVGRLLVADWATDDAGDVLLFVYDGGELDTDSIEGVRLAEHEVDAFGFFSAREARERLDDRLVRRVHAAVGAKRTGSTHSLIHGRPA